jgi:drug/metabolite transporter (DMT)-like permease
MHIILLIITIRTLGDLCFKAAVHKLNFTNVSSFGTNIKRMLLSPFLWLGLTFGISNMLLWCFGLKVLDLSYAYPFLSISYITVIIAGKFLYHEHLDKNKITGICFIILGALFLFL